ncbi:MAG: type II toxin-antitoxin system PemK/MazF family toxin [Betaproteobacteria bacterium]|nr:type II toxin-antitoxin system PemK/MazF family toxin [Betaproteobacteria bacterium]
MKRGDVVICAAPGDYGKPRPAVVVQSDLFNPTHASITLCPITGDLQAAPLFRLNLSPSADSGLKKPSQIMIDKINSQPLKRVGSVIGRLSVDQMRAVDAALRLWLGLQ